MKFFKKILISVLFSSLLIGCSHARVKTDVEKDYGSKTSHGLKHINDKAIEFIEIYNEKNSTNWRSLQPDFRIMVARCVVPLTANWAEYDPHDRLYNIKVDSWYVAVSCNKTVSDIKENKEWTIYVLTTRPRI